MLSVGFFSSINLGQGFMIGEKEATKLKIKEIHFNSLKNWLNCVWQLWFQTFSSWCSCIWLDITWLSICVGVYIHSCVLQYYWVKFHFRHEASCYPVKEMLGNYNTYFIWYEYNIRAGDCLKIFVHCTLI